MAAALRRLYGSDYSIRKSLAETYNPNSPADIRIEVVMKKLLCLGALMLGVAFAGASFAQAQCYEPVYVGVYRAPNYGYYHPRHRVVRQAWIRPAYYGYRPYAYTCWR